MAFEKRLKKLEKDMKRFILKTLEEVHFIKQGELVEKMAGEYKSFSTPERIGRNMASECILNIREEKKVCQYRVWSPNEKKSYPYSSNKSIVVLPEYIEEFKEKFKDWQIESY